MCASDFEYFAGAPYTARIAARSFRVLLTRLTCIPVGDTAPVQDILFHIIIKWLYKLFNAHSRFCPVVGVQYKQLAATRASSQHHALGDAKAHLARGKVGDHHG
jgi:hypothetical protein